MSRASKLLNVFSKVNVANINVRINIAKKNSQCLRNSTAGKALFLHAANPGPILSIPYIPLNIPRSNS